MVDKTRRQGQKKPNGKTAIPKPICPKCDEILNRCYTRGIKNDKRQFIESGWMCPSSNCDYIVKDYVELKETEDIDEVEKNTNDTDKAEKIKELTAEFVKKHEELGRLAEQINELETE